MTSIKMQKMLFVQNGVKSTLNKKMLLRKILFIKSCIEFLFYYIGEENFITLMSEYPFCLALAQM